MAKDRIIVGLEIGTSKICVVVAESGSDGALRILGVGHAPSRGVRKGEMVDFDTAQACVKEALADAEDKADVMIETAYVGVTGGHIGSFNNRGSVAIPEDQEEITEEDCVHVQESAREVALPAGNTYLHSILQHYYVDDQVGVLTPVGMSGSQLQADYHVIHGSLNRVRNSVKCVKEILKQVDEVVFNGLASAQAVLTQHQKDLGALSIDMGGGTTEYVAYVDGAISASGVMAVGGDHITNDLSMGLRIPMARAEKLKCDDGSVILGNSLPGETVFLRDDSGFAGKEVERETLNTIIHMRVREVLELLKRRLEDQGLLEYLGAGVFITGGCSQLKGIKSLAEEVFGLPVTMTRARDLAGVTSALENPQFSTAIGIVKYAQAMSYEPPSKGLFGKLGRLISRVRLF